MRRSRIPELIHPSARQQYALPQQVKFRSAKHLPFDQFETIDIPFNWTGAPVHRKTGVYRQPIAVKVAAEATEFRWASVVYLRDPLIELARAPLTNQDHESLCKSSTCGEFTALSAQVAEQQPFRVIQL